MGCVEIYANHLDCYRGHDPISHALQSRCEMMLRKQL